MAFTFNWTTPTASFHHNAREVLTTALNSSTRTRTPFSSAVEVEDLYFGSKPPDIEVLEIGDGAAPPPGWELGDQEKFRGVFRVRYDGDGWIRLKTKVQINPLHTSLSAAPSFASPSPLFASMPLTLPLEITLSEICLDGYIILVFSRTKGVTLVFRNDPVESLKVESTFDNVPFIRDHLQSSIEAAVRLLFVEELPVAVYRLSLRLLNPELQLGAPEKSPEPATPPPVVSSTSDHGSGDEGEEEDPTISSDNILRLSILLNSQHTLSLFTPAISGCLSRAHLPPPSRPHRVPLTPTLSTTTTPIATPTDSQTPHTPTRRRKRRVINLRAATPGDDEKSSQSASASSVRTPERERERVVRDWGSEGVQEKLRRPRLVRQMAGEGEKGFLKRVRGGGERLPSYRSERSEKQA